MCTGAEIALLAGSVAASAGGSVYAGQQQQSAMDDYNAQVSEANRRKGEQYAARQEKIRAAGSEQNDIFQQIADRQDTEKAQQEQYARDSRQALNETLSNLAGGADQRLDRVQESADERRSIADMAGDFGVTSGYSGSGSSGPDVVREAVDRIAEAGASEGRDMADAGFRLEGFGDLGAGDQQLFRQLGTDLTKTGGAARRSASLAETQMTPMRGRNQALNRSQRFYGGQGYGIPEPVYQQPNTSAANAVQGLGQAGVGIAAQNMFTPSPSGGGGYLRGRTRGTTPPSDGLRG